MRKKHLGLVGMKVRTLVNSGLGGGFHAVYAFLNDDEKAKDMIRSSLSATAQKFSTADLFGVIFLE